MSLAVAAITFTLSVIANHDGEAFSTAGLGPRSTSLVGERHRSALDDGLVELCHNKLGVLGTRELDDRLSLGLATIILEDGELDHAYLVLQEEFTKNVL